MALVMALRIADQHYGWGLAQNGVINDAAAWLTGVLQRLNALLLFAAAVVALGTLVIVPFAMVGLWIRSGLAST